MPGPTFISRNKLEQLDGLVRWAKLAQVVGQIPGGLLTVHEIAVDRVVLLLEAGILDKELKNAIFLVNQRRHFIQGRLFPDHFTVFGCIQDSLVNPDGGTDSRLGASASG